MNDEIEFAKQLYSDLIPYDDPEYEQKLQQYAEAYVEVLNKYAPTNEELIEFTDLS